MKNRLIIHIGTHKTGTTTIQTTLKAHRDALKADGILYPSTSSGDQSDRPKHVIISAAARRVKGIEPVKQRQMLMEEFAQSGCHTMIISEESLSTPQASIQKFFEAFRNDFDIEVICYLRRQDYFLESLYNQFVREPTKQISRNIEKFYKSNKTQTRLDYAAMLDAWRTVSQKVIALDFDAEVKRTDLIKSFAEHLALPTALTASAIFNASPDMRCVLLLSKLNNLGIEYDVKRLIRAGKTVEEQGLFQRMKHILGRELRQQVINDFALSNAALQANYGVGFSEAMPGNEDFYPQNDVSTEYMLAILAAASHMTEKGNSKKKVDANQENKGKMRRAKLRAADESPKAGKKMHNRKGGPKNRLMKRAAVDN